MVGSLNGVVTRACREIEMAIQRVEVANRVDVRGTINIRLKIVKIVGVGRQWK